MIENWIYSFVLVDCSRRYFCHKFSAVYFEPTPLSVVSALLAFTTRCLLSCVCLSVRSCVVVLCVVWCCVVSCLLLCCVLCCALVLLVLLCCVLLCVYPCCMYGLCVWYTLTYGIDLGINYHMIS